MNVVKIADGAYFVASYSEQTIAPAYDTGSTIQSFGFTGLGSDQGADEKPEPRPYPLGEDPFRPALPGASGARR
jgi:hypothetical protein